MREAKKSKKVRFDHDSPSYKKHRIKVGSIRKGYRLDGRVVVVGDDIKLYTAHKEGKEAFSPFMHIEGLSATEWYIGFGNASGTLRLEGADLILELNEREGGE